ncbi:peroxiredoxin family protein [Neobacillus thermocopriae]|uniref:TlpA family protein disulfide reductase n=1 Tax=Neobacillus thermocopriae TaxID=1215031 RepID=A0A6B3TT51_9BACI|nr:TlpA disulfide reductase family protein [Neobacillus thermocopriae]MED3623615.1 TlpA disulfide reductase family protein [Neobacillus thermocopriae]MED3714515.1 TlpA disulfide reductase family protein [Neobacillus thermocopriae]NEX80013.1 TlpA family protein disulfide reductase [Neobacillus thermocopriae]
MIKKVLAAVVLISLLTVAIVQAVNKNSDVPESTNTTSATKEGLSVGAKAPDFELKTLSGDSVKLSDLKGKKVMLNFWATWCPPCKEEMPAMEKLHKEAGEDLLILAVNIDPHLDVQGFVNENKLTFPILLDTDDTVNEKYQILSIPTTYFIDSKGIIRHVSLGSMEFDEMKELTEKLK